MTRRRDYVGRERQEGSSAGAGQSYETHPFSLTSCLISSSYSAKKWTDYFGIQGNVNSTPTPSACPALTTSKFWKIDHILPSFTPSYITLDVFMEKIYALIFLPMGRYDVVGTATRYGLGGPEIESRWGKDFPHPPRPALGPTHLL